MVKAFWGFKLNSFIITTVLKRRENTEDMDVSKKDTTTIGSIVDVFKQNG